MKKILTLVSILAMSLGFAGELSYDQFKESCKNPGAYGHQNPPTKIKLQCKNSFKGWQPIESGSTRLSESRFITSELFSNKHTVASKTSGVRVPEQIATCPRFREVMETAAIEVSLTCDQVTSDERDLQEICLSELDSAIAENADIVETTPTGSIYSVCGAQQQQQEDKE